VLNAVKAECHVAPASADTLDRAIATNRRLSAAEANLARLIDSVIDDDASPAPEMSSGQRRYGTPQAYIG
jgi:hypothetical protein